MQANKNYSSLGAIFNKPENVIINLGQVVSLELLAVEAWDGPDTLLGRPDPLLEGPDALLVGSEVLLVEPEVLVVGPDVLLDGPNALLV